MLAAGFCDLASQPLRNFDCLSHASALRYQPWNIRTCSQVAAILEILHANADRHFLNFRQMFLPSHSHHHSGKASANSTMLARTVSLVSYAGLDRKSGKGETSAKGGRLLKFLRQARSPPPRVVAGL